MSDNPRFALYGASYTCLLANKLDQPAEFPCSVVGRCCESGDIIQEHVLLPGSVGRGDILAVCTTGAYNYPWPPITTAFPGLPIVMLRGGNESYVAIGRRESLEDLNAATTCKNAQGAAPPGAAPFQPVENVFDRPPDFGAFERFQKSFDPTRKTTRTVFFHTIFPLRILLREGFTS